MSTHRFVVRGLSTTDQLDFYSLRVHCLEWGRGLWPGLNRAGSQSWDGAVGRTIPDERPTAETAQPAPAAVVEYSATQRDG